MILRVIQQVFVEHLLCEDAVLGVEILEEAGGTWLALGELKILLGSWNNTAIRFLKNYSL